MANASDKEIGGSLRIVLRCIGLEAEAAGYVRMRKTARQSPEKPAIDEQGEIIEGEIVEDVLPADVKGLEKL